jgi:hypothetical protein
MIESPLIQEFVAAKLHNLIVETLTERFGSVPPEVATALRAVQDESRLNELLKCAAFRCPDLEAFRARLMS